MLAIRSREYTPANHAVNGSGRYRSFEVEVYGGRPVKAVVMRQESDRVTEPNDRDRSKS